MDPKLVYWTLALVDLGAVAACLLAGVRRIRRRDVPGHRQVTAIFVLTDMYARAGA